MAPFIPGLLGLGGGGLGAAALVGGGLLISGGGGGGSGGGRRPPTVDQPESVSTLTTNTVNPTLTVTGTGHPGDTVKVTIGSTIATTTITSGGTWSVTVPRGNFPADGTYESVVVVTPPEGSPITLDGPGFIIDMTPPALSVTEGTQAAGHVENLAAHANGVQIGGTGEPGAAIRVEIGSHVQTTTVAANGSWTVTFSTTQLPGGEYTVPARITATDPLGNTTVVNDNVVIDTVPHPITIGAVTGDNLVNAAEATGGFAIVGTTTAGATVTVTVGGITRTATAGAGGAWSISFGPGELTPGEYDATITASTVDAAGNASSTTSTFRVDTVAMVTLNGPVAVDDVVNATEAAAGVVLTGTTQPGSTVQVAWNGSTLPATVGANGQWTVTFPGSSIPTGEYSSTVTVTATDAAGNTASATRIVGIDTQNPLTITSPVAGNDLANAAEVAAGFSITGTAAPGASVVVTVGGQTYGATATASGTWSIAIAPGALAPGEYDAPITARSTDTAGNSATATHTMRVDTVMSATITGPVEGDDIVNGVEAADGVGLSGTAQPGSTVEVTFAGTTRTVTATAEGTWYSAFPTQRIEGGEYPTSVSITATDAAGNTATATRPVRIDTTTSVTIDPAQAGGDNIVSGAERGTGVALTGRAEAGASVAVTFEGVTRTVTAAGDGTWTATFSAAEVRTGTYTSTVTVRATDAAGNVATTSHTLAVDTEVVPFSRSTLSYGSDQVLNAAEAAVGMTVTGVVEPGSNVVVRFGTGPGRTAQVAADGTWTVTIPPGDIPQGENSVALNVSATDRVGNTASLTEQVTVDTRVRNFARSGGQIGGDGVLNAAEVAAGLPLTGTVEPGANVVVTLSNGATRSVTAAADGTWTATFASSELPRGESSVTATMVATDRAGNTATLTDSFRVDTVAPGAPEVISFGRNGSGLRAIGVEVTDDTYSFHQVSAAGGRSALPATSSYDPVFDATNYVFQTAVPDGSYLVIDTRDPAGNASSTLLVVDNRSAAVVDLGRNGLSTFDLSTIDLSFAPDARLSITETQLAAITGPDQRLTVMGDANDTVTMTGAVATGSTQMIDGQRYALYTLGSSGGTLLIDEDIRTVL
jgi:hypothetical protein